MNKSIEPPKKKWDLSRSKGLFYMFISAMMASTMNLLIKFTNDYTSITVI